MALNHQAVEAEVGSLLRDAVKQRTAAADVRWVAYHHHIREAATHIEEHMPHRRIAVLAVTEEKLGTSCDSTPEEEEALIYGRNSDWVEKIPAIIGDKSTLFVVGAAHLPGERGVLELLKKEGYTVEGVK